MKKFTNLLFFLFVAIGAFAQTQKTATWTTSSVFTDENHMQEISQELTITEGYTFSFAVGTQANGLYPRYYTSDGIRMYNGNQMTVKGTNIVKIEIEAVSTSYVGALTANTGAVATTGTAVTWTGKADEITLTNTNSQLRFATFTITYEEATATNPLDAMVASPAEGTITALGEIELSFGGAALTANEDANVEFQKNGETYLDGMAYMGDDNTIVYLNNADEQRITAPGTYTVVVPAGAITVDGTSLPQFSLNYVIETPKVDPIEVLAINPAQGVVEDLQNFIISFNNLPVTVAEREDIEIILTKDGEDFAYGAILSQGTSAKVELESKITAPGQYVLNIPGNVITVDGEAIVEPLSFNYTIKDPNAKEYTIDPEEGTVQSMQLFSITFDAGYAEANTEAIPVLKNNTSGATYNGMLYDVTGKINAYFSDPITEPGEYTLTIPANSIEILSTGQKYGELTFNYTIAGDEPNPGEQTVQLPEGVEPETWAASGYYWYYNSGWQYEAMEGNSEFTFQVAFDGNDVYISGFNVYMPEVWAKGSLNGNEVTFASGQYMGMLTQNGEEYVFYLIGTESSEPYGVADFKFTYDAQQKTLTAVNGVDPTLSSDGSADRLYCFLTELVLNGGDPNSINENVGTGEGSKGELFDIAGRKVSSDAKGILIKKTTDSEGNIKTVKVIK